MSKLEALLGAVGILLLLAVGLPTLFYVFVTNKWPWSK